MVNNCNVIERFEDLTITLQGTAGDTGTALRRNTAQIFMLQQGQGEQENRTTTYTRCVEDEPQSQLGFHTG